MGGLAFHGAPIGLTCATDAVESLTFFGQSRSLKLANALLLSSNLQIHRSKINAHLLSSWGVGMTDFTLNQTVDQSGPVQPASRPNLDKGFNPLTMIFFFGVLTAQGLSIADPSGTGIAAKLRGNFGIFAVVEQTLYRPPSVTEKGVSASLPGVTAFGRIAYSPPDRNLIDLYLDGGMLVLSPAAPSTGSAWR
jgi:hypothetical protein